MSQGDQRVVFVSALFRRPQQALREGRLQVVSMKWAAASLLLWACLPPRSLPPAQPYQLLRSLPKPNPEFLTKQPRSVAIVGGGLAGCTAAKVLLQQGYQVHIFEQNSALHCSQTGAIPDFPRHRENCDAYIQRFCESFGLDASLHFHCRVLALHQQESGWQLRTSQGHFECDFLIVAAGFQPVPTSIQQHALVYSDEHLPELQGKEVLLVGSVAASAPVLKRLKQARVTCVIPEHEEVGLSGLLTTVLAHTRLSAFLQRSHNGLSGVLARTGETLLTWVYGLAWPGHLPNALSFTQALAQVEAGHSLEGARVLRGSVDVSDACVRVGQTVVHCDAVVFVRETRPGLGLLHGESEGLYRNTVLPGLRNAAFIGQFRSQEQALLTSLQVKWLADVLRGRVVLPSFEYMKGRPLSWRCSAYEAADLFLKDCGLLIYRRSWAAEFLLGISASNYSEVLTHSR